jgi:nitronate monooxygenase
LLQIVLELTDRPVVAAGGIASGRGLAAVLAAGAVGAWAGTPFLLAEEARNSTAARERIARSDETETLYTSVYDRLQDKGWPAEFRARAIRNAFGARWTGHEDELGAGTEPRQEFIEARAAQDYDIAHIYAGQSIGMLDAVRPAAAIVADIEAQARELLARW